LSGTRHIPAEIGGDEIWSIQVSLSVKMKTIRFPEDAFSAQRLDRSQFAEPV
jgi:hypothetical protein